MPAPIDHATAASVDYDALVVGSGVSGAIVARSLAEKGLRVLVVEAGPGDELSVADYESYLVRFYGAAAKDNLIGSEQGRRSDRRRAAEVKEPARSSGCQPGAAIGEGERA